MMKVLVLQSHLITFGKCTKFKNKCSLIKICIVPYLPPEIMRQYLSKIVSSKILRENRYSETS